MKPSKSMIPSLLIVLTYLWGCATEPAPKKREPLPDVDAPKQRKQDNKRRRPPSLVDTVDRKIAKSIDGRLGDWNPDAFRTFENEGLVVDGAKFRDDVEDLSFEVAVESDKGYFYTAVRVTDETVVEAGSKRPIADGVVITVRDPLLESLADRMPPDYRRTMKIYPETSMILTPDGQFYAYGDTGSINRSAIRAQSRITKDGYVLEVAFKPEILEQVYRLPIKDLAFRIELLDGDKPERRGTQTTMSIFERQSDAEMRRKRRFMLYSMNKIFPHDYVDGGSQQLKQIGRWRHQQSRWQFQRFDRTSTTWKRVANPADMLGDFSRDEKIEKYCPQATSYMKPLAWHRSTTQNKKAQGIFACVRDTEHKKLCDTKNPVYLLWSVAEKQNKRWVLTNTTRVIKQPVRDVCLDRQKFPEPGTLFLSELKTIPLQHTGLPIWGIYWKRLNIEGSREEGIRFVNPENDPAQAENEFLYKKYVNNGREEINRSNLFLTPVDSDRNLDLCIIERSRKQTCAKGACNTIADSTNITNRIRTWNTKKEAFEKLFLSKHENCTNDFKFSERKGYYLVPWQNDLAIIASPKNR